MRDQDFGEGVDDHQSTSALLDSIRINIKRLRKRSTLKPELYSYLIDLIEEDATIEDEDVCIHLCVITRLTSLAVLFPGF